MFRLFATGTGSLSALRCIVGRRKHTGREQSILFCRLSVFPVKHIELSGLIWYANMYFCVCEKMPCRPVTFSWRRIVNMNTVNEMVTFLFGCVWLIYLEKAIIALKTPGGWDASSTALWSLYTLYISHCWFFFLYLADVMPVVGCMLLAMYSKRWFQWIIKTAQFIVTCFRNTVSKFDWRFIIYIWEKNALFLWNYYFDQCYRQLCPWGHIWLTFEYRYRSFHWGKWISKSCLWPFCLLNKRCNVWYATQAPRLLFAKLMVRFLAPKSDEVS